MKKLITLLLAVMMLLSLAACGNDDQAADDKDAANTEDTTQTAAPADADDGAVLKILETEYVVEEYAIAVAKDNEALLAQVNDALKAIAEDGTLDAVINYYISGEGELPVYQQDVAADAEVLTLGTSVDFPPYEFYEGETPVGIDIAIAGLIADQLGMKLEIVDMNFDAIIPSIVSGKVDIGMAGMTVTDERLETVSFSESYSTGVQVVIVPADSDITSLDDVFAKAESEDGIQIGVQVGTTGYIYASDDFGEESVQAFAKYGDVIQALKTGKIDCVIMDQAPAENYVASVNANG